jgi:hypothetical protein
LKFIGFVEHVDNTRITGWVYFPDDEAAHPEVVATLDDIDIGSAHANVIRKDLAARGLGAGDRGFEIDISITIKPEDADAVEIFVIDPAGQRAPLSRIGTGPPVGRMGHGAIPVEREADPFTDLDLSRPEAFPPAPPVAVATEDLLAGRTSDPSADLDPFADLDLRQETRPALPAAPAFPPPVAAADAGDTGTLQIFVLGAARSGTSALFTALRSVFGLPGYGESHVIPAFQRMIHQLRQYVEMFDSSREDIMIKHMGAAPVEALLFNYVREFYRTTYAVGGGFVDKTPTGEAIYGGPLIEAIFPGACLLVTRRNGIEVVQSFRLKFSSDFTDACLAWAEAMSGIQHARLRCQRLMEVDQFDMANQPERTGRRIAGWLGFPQHGEALGRFFARERIEKSSTHDWSRRLTLANVDWTPAEKATFTRICGRMMEAFDYAM